MIGTRKTNSRDYCYQPLEVFSLLLTLVLTACIQVTGTAPTQSVSMPEVVTPAHTPDLTAALAPLDTDPDQAALYGFILDELAGTERQHLLVAMVKPNLNDPRGKLDLRAGNVLHAWVYVDGSLHDCSTTFFVQNYAKGTNGPWEYAYMAFSINKVSLDFDAATLRIDRIPGLIGGKGELLELVRTGGQWSIESQRVTWIQ